MVNHNAKKGAKRRNRVPARRQAEGRRETRTLVEGNGHW